MIESVDPFEQLSLAQLRARTSVKWRAYDPDVLPLWVAEMDVRPAEAAQRAVHDAFAAGDTGYAWGTEYAEAYASFAVDRWGFEPDVSAAMMVADTMQGIYELIGLLTKPNEPVIVTSPVYPPFYAYARHAHREVREVPLLADRLDLDGLEAAFIDVARARGSAVLLLCNPHNPTGTVHSRAELEALATIANRHGIRVVADEVHAPLAYDATEFTPYISVDARAFAVTSASKAWNLAGLRTALIVAGAEARAELAAMPEIVTHGPNHLAAKAHAAALAHGREWLDEVVAALAIRKRLVADLVATRLPGVGFRVPDATFLAWLDWSGTSLAVPNAVAEPGDVQLAAGPSAQLLREARVAVNAGESFGTGGENRVRVNFATRLDVLDEAFARMGRVLAP